MSRDESGGDAPLPEDLPSNSERPRSIESRAATTLVDCPPISFAPPSATAPAAVPTLANLHPSDPKPVEDEDEPHHVRFPLGLDTSSHGLTRSDGITRSDTALTQGFSPLRRRMTRAATFKPVDDFREFEQRPGWRPGAEPGFDPNKSDGGHSSMPQLSALCDITVVDFSEENLAIQHLDNDTLPPFLKRQQPEWVKCRWINVNGLSWDVIQTLGQYKKLHKLALEDIMNTKNRTKAEWFPTHAFMVLTLQKLVQTIDSDSESSESEEDDAKSWTSGRSGRSHKRLGRRIKKFFRRKPSRATAPATFDQAPTLERNQSHGSSNVLDGTYLKAQPTGFSSSSDPRGLRTLQRYHASANDPRTVFFERHSSLSSKHLAVACEQVSIFITFDNTIISFFELSAPDIELPIIRRLQTADTILRHSCDASMVCQAIIDAVIDLALPVSACYADTIGDLELDVLTRPHVQHTKELYVIITEINKMLSFINPIFNLITALRDHKTDLSQAEATKQLRNPAMGVLISPMTFTYLGDVLDHCVLITDALNQLKSSADNMIDLIFNTVSTYQNESMKQLTVVTIIFLPLTFLTGYFGQNFENFDILHTDLGPNVFWAIAGPVSLLTLIVLMREVIWDYLQVLGQRRHIAQLRSNRNRRRKMQKAQKVKNI